MNPQTDTPESAEAMTSLDDLRTMLVRLVQQLRKHDPDNAVAKAALGLLGKPNVLRAATSVPIPPGYRMLNVGEIMDPEDMFWENGKGPWKILSESKDCEESIGQPVEAQQFAIIRFVSHESFLQNATAQQSDTALKLQRCEEALRLAAQTLGDAPELNMANYTEEDVSILNDFAIAVHNILNAALTHPTRNEGEKKA